MNSYARGSYEQVQYATNGRNAAWSDGHGYGGNAAWSDGYGYGGFRKDAYSFGGGGNGYNGFSGGGNMAAAGQSWSGGYGNESGNYSGGGGYGGGYGSNGGHMVAVGGGGGGYGKFQVHENKNKVENMAAETVVEKECDLISALVPTSFPPGTDPKIVECFNGMDRDRNGSISDHELKSALTTLNQNFSLRTVHLLMFLFTGSNEKDVTPREFVPLIRSLLFWKACFEKHDRNKNGSLDEMELSEAMRSMNYIISPFVRRLLVSKFAKSGNNSGIEYDYFIECCLIIRGLTEKFKMKEDPYTGTASFTYDEFLINILPFVIVN